ncbi:MAG: histidine triad (HIT) family protein [Flavobacteriales bacterium]|jgi:histidine triad (HIT) family protein|tara:strand:- start:4859 stop:5251 length:393 start_codon:yes stop_codon:yes gene_type:complete
MASIFTKIVKGEIPAYKIAEDENFLAFLDVFPLAKGHVLVIPKQEIDSIFDLSDESYTNLWLFAKKTAKALKRVMPCKRVGIAVIGLEVPHAHIHLIPLQNVEDINFSKPKLKVEDAEMKGIAENIKEKF